jgi:hypothetical protein
MKLPASARKLRLFRLGLGAQFAFAALIVLGNPSPAAAQLQVCNNTKVDIVVAYPPTPGRWMSCWPSAKES